MLSVLPAVDTDAGILLLPKTTLEAHEVALVINEADPLSRDIGDYYRQRRAIPADNVIRLSFDPEPTLSVERFKTLYAQVVAATPAQVQAYALAWPRPYRVGCQSITTAFATGYDPAFCGQRRPERPCAFGGRSPYFSSRSSAPHEDFGLRPGMLLAAGTIEDAKRLIDRGIAADGRFPHGSAYLLSTSDTARTVRDRSFDRVQTEFGQRLPVVILEQDDLRDRDDVLFYFTGRVRVDHLDTLTFLPGAVGDHLTSAGGHLLPEEQTSQMSALRWLEAGATGSFGTVVEPCNYPQKFPDPPTLMRYYLGGASLIEAYWKSVAWPGEGVFIGEPLAAPFARRLHRFEGRSTSVQPHALAIGRYRIERSAFPVGPYVDTGQRVAVSRPDEATRIEGLDSRYLRLVRIQ
jgi:uncharacterized protein (TIGR03790 family)